MMYNIDQKKWLTFSKEQQLGNIAAELSRASHAGLFDTESKKEQVKSAYERAIILIDASLEDPKWQDKTKMRILRDAVSSLYFGIADPAIARFIYSQLLEDSLLSMG